MANPDSLFVAGENGVQISLSDNLHVVQIIIIPARVAFYGQEVQKRADIFFCRRHNTFTHGIVIQLLVGNAECFGWDVLQDIPFQLCKTCKDAVCLSLGRSGVLKEG